MPEGGDVVWARGNPVRTGISIGILIERSDVSRNLRLGVPSVVRRLNLIYPVCYFFLVFSIALPTMVVDDEN